MLNWRASAALFVLRIVATALNHEVGNDAVKNGAVVVFVLDVLQKVGNCFGRFVWIDFHHDVAHVGGNFEFGCVLCIDNARDHTSCKQGKRRKVLEKMTSKKERCHVFIAKYACWSGWWFLQRGPAKATGRWHLHFGLGDRLFGPMRCTNRLSFAAQFCNWVGPGWPFEGP